MGPNVEERCNQSAWSIPYSASLLRTCLKPSPLLTSQLRAGHAERGRIAGLLAEDPRDCRLCEHLGERVAMGWWVYGRCWMKLEICPCHWCWLALLGRSEEKRARLPGGNSHRAGADRQQQGAGSRQHWLVDTHQSPDNHGSRTLLYKDQLASVYTFSQNGLCPTQRSRQLEPQLSRSGISRECEQASEGQRRQQRTESKRASFRQRQHRRQ